MCIKGFHAIKLKKKECNTCILNQKIIFKWLMIPFSIQLKVLGFGTFNLT